MWVTAHRGCALHHKGLPGQASVRGTCVSWWALPVLLLPHLSDINFPELLQPYVTAPALLAAFFWGERCWFTEVLQHFGCSSWVRAREQSKGEVKRGGKSWSWRKVTLQHSCFYLSPRDACKEKTNLIDGCIFKRMQCKAGVSWHLIDPGLGLCCFQRFTFSRV